MQIYRQVMVENEISVGAPVSERGKITICGVEYLVSRPTHTSASVLEIVDTTPCRVFDGVFNSGLLSPTDESMLRDLLIGAISEEPADI